MKKVLLVLISFLSLNAFGQQSNGLPENIAKDIEILKKADLNLSDIQLSRITRVLLGQDELMKKNLQSPEPNKAAMKKRLSDLRTNKIKNITGAMNEEQVAKFNTLKLAEKL